VRRCYRFVVVGYVVMPEHDAASTAQGSGAHPSKTAKGGATEVMVMQRLGQPPRWRPPPKSICDTLLAEVFVENISATISEAR
jgi:hypothetical protein